MDNAAELLCSFLDEEKRLIKYPARYKKKIIAHFYLAEKFEKNRTYTEKEINEILNLWHTFGDCATLRRGLCDGHFLARERDCGKYWVPEEQPTPEQFGVEL